MPNRGVGVTDQATGAGVADVRVRERQITAVTYAEQFVIPISERVVTARVKTATFRIIGTTATTYNLFSLENTAGSAVTIAITKIRTYIEVSAVTAYLVQNATKLFRSVVTPTGGTTLTKHLLDPSGSSAANVVARGGSSSDTLLTAITHAFPAGNPMWTQPWDKTMTGVGQHYVDASRFMGEGSDDDALLLTAGQTALIVYNPGAGAVQLHHSINVEWDEFTIP